MKFSVFFKRKDIRNSDKYNCYNDNRILTNDK